jgi:hypothetical protein
VRKDGRSFVAPGVVGPAAPEQPGDDAPAPTTGIATSGPEPGPEPEDSDRRRIAADFYFGRSVEPDRCSEVAPLTWSTTSKGPAGVGGSPPRLEQRTALAATVGQTDIRRSGRHDWEPPGAASV